MATAVIDTDFDSAVTSDGTENETGTTIGAGETTTLGVRAQLRFSLSGITAGSTVTDSDLQFNITSETVEASEGLDFRPYNNTGDDDPDPDSGATKYSRSAPVTSLVTLVTNGLTGTQSVDLGTTADGQIQGNISSPAIYSIGIIGLATDAGTDDRTFIEAIENAGTDPATLTVVYTEPSGGLTNPIGGGILDT